VTTARIITVGAVCTVAPVIYALFAFDLFDSLRTLGIPAWSVAAGVIVLGALVIVMATPELRRPGDIKTKAAFATAIIPLLGAAALIVDARYPAKFIHLPEYLLLGWAIAKLLAPGLPIRTVLPCTVALLAASALVDENIQGYMAERSFGLRDIAVDMIAGLAGAMAAMIGHRDAHPMTRNEHLVLITAWAPVLAAALFAAYASSRFAALYLPPALFVLAPLCIAAFASFASASILPADRSRSPAVTPLCLLLGCMALAPLAVHGVRLFGPLVFH
jgi:hypothetical protein